MHIKQRQNGFSAGAQERQHTAMMLRRNRKSPLWPKWKFNRKRQTPSKWHEIVYNNNDCDGVWFHHCNNFPATRCHCGGRIEYGTPNKCCCCNKSLFCCCFFLAVLKPMPYNCTSIHLICTVCVVVFVVGAAASSKHLGDHREVDWSGGNECFGRGVVVQQD